MPFLGEKSYLKYFPNKKISTIQTELIYEKLDDQFVDGLEIKIQNYIQKKYIYLNIERYFSCVLIA